MSGSHEPSPILVINLESASARWEAMTAQLAAQGLVCRRVPAVLGASLNEDQVRSVYSESLNRRHYFRPLKPSEIGCYASHMAAARTIDETGAAAAVVLEDDALIGPGFRATTSSLTPFHADFDVIKLYDGRARGRVLHDLGEGRSLVRYDRIGSGAVAYVLSARGAAKLLAKAAPGGRPFDLQFKHWWEFDLNVAGVTPNVVTHPGEFESLIGERKRLDRAAGTQWRRLEYKLGYSLARLRHGGSRQGA